MSTGAAFRRQAAALALFLVVCAAVFAAMWRFAGGDLNPLDNPYRVQAVVPSAVALAAHADVRQAGVRVGEVRQIAQRGDNAVLMLELDREHAPAYRDARVLVRTKTLSGENYVALDPGTPRAGRVPSGDVLPLARAGEAVQLDDILSTLDRTRRRSLQRALDGLGGGLRSRGRDLNRFLEATSALIEQSAPVNEVLAADRAQVAALVHDFGRVAGAIGERRDAVRVLVRRAGELAAAVAARDARLRQTLTTLPAFLRQARATTADLGAFSRQATPVVADLAGATEQLAPAVRDLGPAAARARVTMRALAAFTAKASPLAAHVRPFASAAARATAPLDASLRELNPLVGHLAPYTRDILSLLATQRAGAENYDALGHYGRVAGVFSKSSVFGVLTPEQDGALRALLKTGVLSVLETRGDNAYPKPGGADDLQPFSDDYERLQADPPYNR